MDNSIHSAAGNHGLDEHDVAWANFVASLDPAELERERARVSGNLTAELFSSREHRGMVRAHRFLADDYWARVRAGRPLPPTDGEWAHRRTVQNADADAEIARRGFGTAAPIEAAIRTYSQRQAAAAAERTAA